MIAIIDGCGSNVASIQYAIKRLGKNSILTSDPAVIRSATQVIIPGVSSAGRALQSLQQNGLCEVIKDLTQPVLGICSGMQILFQWCAEGDVEALNIFPEKVEKLKPAKDLPLPHMGWNNLAIIKPNCSLLKGIANLSYVYYVHSYAAKLIENTVAISEYDEPFSAIVAKDNFYGMQFHPERSGKIGERLLFNFLAEGE